MPPVFFRPRDREEESDAAREKFMVPAAMGMSVPLLVSGAGERSLDDVAHVSAVEDEQIQRLVVFRTLHSGRASARTSAFSADLARG